jgi:hypothetical protein
MNELDKKMYWEVLVIEYLFTEPWLTVRCDTIKLPNGEQYPCGGSCP